MYDNLQIVIHMYTVCTCSTYIVCTDYYNYTIGPTPFNLDNFYTCTYVHVHVVWGLQEFLSVFVMCVITLVLSGFFLDIQCTCNYI